MNRTGFKVTIKVALAVVVLAGQATGGPPKSEVAKQGSNVRQETQEDEGHAKQCFKVFPVGIVQKKRGTTCLKIADQYGEALKGLDGFSHVVVLYWFHKNDTPSKRSILQSRLERFPNKPLAGVFASRAPMRPNLIALSVCRILSVEGNTVRVASIDAFDGTPILDLKPHIPVIDCPGNVKLADWWRPAGFGGPGGQGQGGQGRGGPGGGNFVERVMGFDKNGDGKVTKDEMPERMKQRLLQRADTNGDGAIDKKEAEKMAERFQRGGV
jgi:tRNA-Thr(GGU) m(6)t(6)A37 methyltransferase TsaA